MMCQKNPKDFPRNHKKSFWLSGETHTWHATAFLGEMASISAVALREESTGAKDPSFSACTAMRYLE